MTYHSLKSVSLNLNTGMQNHRFHFIEKSIVQLENAISVLLGRNPGPIPRGQMINDLVLPEIPESLPSTIT
ncbi:MAG: hypothetical protein MZV64_41510 [Ignavibacteriales bacterium]|nr:hypothetical protein [Ignavibacteriales bacterium]